MKHLISSLFVAASLAACSTGTPDATSSSQAATSVKICTPYDETCDIGCFFQHGPSSSDCIIRCNATGTAWDTLEDCGWAQNGQTSASCLDKDPHPVCENN